VSVKRVKELEVVSKLKVGIQADGDLIGEAPACFNVLPLALNLVV
jgi:diacylglycerol kinase family enzyme